MSLTLTKEQFKKDPSPTFASYSAEIKPDIAALPNLLKKVFFQIEIKGEAVNEDQVFDSLLLKINGMLEKLNDFAGKAADELLDSFNEDWNEDGDEVDREEFAKRLKLESITARSDGTSEIYFDDGELFQGHVIVVNVDAEGNVSAEIAG